MQVLVRHGTPNKYDLAPKGTICKVVSFCGQIALYEQVSDDEDNPKWVEIENVLSTAT